MSWVVGEGREEAGHSLFVFIYKRWFVWPKQMFDMEMMPKLTVLA